MKVMNHRIEMLKNLLAVSLIAFSLPVIGQQMNFSQYRLTPLLNNPSLIAATEEIKADFGYRNQFGGQQGNYATPFISGSMPLYTKTSNDQLKKFGAAGVLLLTDRTGYNGMLATTGFSVAYTHIANFSRVDRIAFGLQPGIFQRKVDFSRLSTGSQWDGFSGAYDPNRPINESITSVERRMFFTINAGATYIRENSKGEPLLTVSLGGNNLSRPNISLNSKTFNNPINWNIQASVLAFENNQFQIKPSFRHIQSNNLNQTNLGSYFYYKLSEKGSFIKEGNIGLGLWYSNKNAFVTALEINQRDWAIGISYDFITSALADASNRTGAPEIIVGFRKYIGNRKK
jgi:type IX secretion system PorP/SprF family membrane protein